jgi:hypothetical protein
MLMIQYEEARIFFFCRYKSILTESQNLITENFAIWDLGDNIQQYAAFDELNQLSV